MGTSILELKAMSSFKSPHLEVEMRTARSGCPKSGVVLKVESGVVLRVELS